MTVKEHLFDLLERRETTAKRARFVRGFLLAIILANFASVYLESMQGAENYDRFFRIAETMSIAIFTVEYLLRVFVADLHPEYSSPFIGRLRFMLTPMALVDALSIVPFYFPILIPYDLRTLRLLRVLRLFSVFKVARFSHAFQVLGRSVNRCRAQLTLCFTFIGLLLVVSASLMYYAEKGVQPEKFGSMFHALYWSVITLTTVGYGDVTPLTTWGKVLGSLIATLGILAFALPTAILGGSFVLEANNEPSDRICPHCSKTIENK